MITQIPYTCLLPFITLRSAFHPADSSPASSFVFAFSASSFDLALSVVYRTFFTYQYDTDDYLRSILIIPVHSNVLILNESKTSLDEGAHKNI